MAQKFVGIDLGTHRVKGAVVTVGFRGVTVHQTFEAPVEAQGDGEAQLAAAAAVALRTLEERGLSQLPVGLAISGSMASYRVLKFPFADAKRINQALAFEMEGQFPQPLTELQFDHVIAPSTGRRGGQALIVAVRKSLLEAVTATYRESGVDLRLVTASPIALAQTLAGEVAPLGEVEGDRTVTPAALIVDVGARSTEIVVLGEKGPLAIRSLRRGGGHLTRAIGRSFGLDEAAAEAAKLEGAFLPHAALGELSPEQARAAELSTRALEVVVREIEQTRLWLRTELDYEVTELRLAGGGVSLRGMPEYLHEQLGLPVHAVEPRLKLTGALPPEGWALFATALGAAMGAVKRPLIRLNDASAVERDAGWLTEQFGALSLIGVAILAFASIDTIVKIRALETELTRHEEELEAVTRRHFGEALVSKSAIEGRLAAVEGEDLTRVLPVRGAFEVMQMVAHAASPTDAGSAAAATKTAPSAGADDELVLDEDNEGEAEDDTEGGEDPTGSGGGEAVADDTGSRGPVPLAAGIVSDDELQLAVLDIRERKMELKVSATRAAAQDRLAIKLEALGCISSITKGKITDRNERRIFEMSLDHECYREIKTIAEDEDEDDEQEEMG